MTDTTEKLLPCRCGADCASPGTADNLWKVVCYNCLEQTAGYLNEAEACAAWNRWVADKPKWTKETPTEWGLYWVLQEGYKHELAGAGHPPLVLLMHFPRNGDIEEFWRVKLVAGCFFHHHGSLSSIWAKDPTLEWMLEHYDIKGWLKINKPALPEEGEAT